MSPPSRLCQRVGVLGIVYTVLFAVGFVVSGPQSSETASPAAVIHNYTVHKTGMVAGVFLVAVAAVALVLFAASVRRFVTRDGDSRVLGAGITAGSAVYATGVLFMGMLMISLVDAAKHSLGGVAQTLNIVANDSWVPIVAGISMTTLATGIVGLRSGALPRWVGWVSVVLGIMAVAGPVGAIAFLVFPVWVLVVAVVLLRAPADITELPLTVATARS